MAFTIVRDDRLTKIEEFNVEVTPPNVSPESKKEWKTHSSKRFGYSFSYPEGWFLLAYDEENPQVIFGSHSLSNYDPNLAENFMDHGIIDWQKFIGEKIAIKVDLSVQRLGDLSRAQFIENYYKEATLQPNTDLKFGMLETIQYNSPDAITDKLTRSFLAFTSDSRVATANVFVSNQPNQVILQDTEEWKELESILKTFKFE